MKTETRYHPELRDRVLVLPEGKIGTITAIDQYCPKSEKFAQVTFRDGETEGPDLTDLTWSKDGQMWIYKKENSHD